MDLLDTTGKKGAVPRMNETVFMSHVDSDGVSSKTKAKSKHTWSKSENKGKHEILTLVDPATLFVLYKG